MTDTHGATRIIGSLRTADGKSIVRIEDLWSALTDPQRLARWYGTVEGDLRQGGQFHLHIEAAGLHAVGRIEVCEPPQRLLVTTREIDDPSPHGEDDHTIEATLTRDGDHTRLVIEARGMPLKKIAFYGAGWQIHAENLAKHVAGHDTRSHDQARWAELVPPYQKLAADIG